MEGENDFPKICNGIVKSFFLKKCKLKKVNIKTPTFPSLTKTTAYISSCQIMPQIVPVSNLTFVF